MKKAIIVLMIMMCSIATVSAQTFEGTFVMHVQDDNSVNMINIAVRKDKLILQPIDPTLPKPVKILMSKNSNDVFVLTEEQGMKLAVKYTFQPPSPAADSLKPKISIQETGKTKTIEEYLCKELLVDDGAEQKLQLWVTPELGFTMADFSEYLGKFSAVLNDGNYQDVTKYNAYDAYKKNMALEIKEMKEKDATIILIKKIEKTTLPESDFTTEGYLVVNAKDIWGGAKE
ncbi:MAG TPA: hypothetical protein VK750_07995 [Cytophagaceae bacterium]|jgi:hypothetical protein|nr:hypothetical protein [Cytophagaceae bacterium]